MQNQESEKRFISTVVSEKNLEKYIKLGWFEVSRITNLCGVFVTIRKEIEGGLHESSSNR